MDFKPSLNSSSERCLAASDEPPMPNTDIVEALIMFFERMLTSSQVTKEKDLSMLSILDANTF